MDSKLFSSFKLGALELQNRVVMSPMTRCRAIGNIPNTLEATYYGQRASAGLIITEGTAPSANGLGYARIPGIFNEAQIEGWKKVAQAVHAKGGKIFMQLMHTGRVSHPDNMAPDAVMMAPSAIALEGQMYTDNGGMQDHPVPHAMTKEDIERELEGFVSASKNAMAAGLDGVELHGANGYLIEQFINPASNQRDDEYGTQNVENRARFAIEAATRVAAAIGPEHLGIRLSPYGAFNGMAQFDEIDETYVHIAKAMDALNLCYIHLVDHSSMGAPTVGADIKAKIRQNFTGALILSGGFDRARAEVELLEERGDLVAFGRPFISNPDLVHRLQANAALAEADFSTFYTPGEKGYTDYPTL